MFTFGTSREELERALGTFPGPRAFNPLQYQQEIKRLLDSAPANLNIPSSSLGASFGPFVGPLQASSAPTAPVETPIPRPAAPAPPTRATSFTVTSARPTPTFNDNQEVSVLSDSFSSAAPSTPARVTSTSSAVPSSVAATYKENLEQLASNLTPQQKTEAQTTAAATAPSSPAPTSLSSSYAKNIQALKENLTSSDDIEDKTVNQQIPSFNIDEFQDLLTRLESSKKAQVAQKGTEGRRGIMSKGMQSMFRTF